MAQTRFREKELQKTRWAGKGLAPARYELAPARYELAIGAPLNSIIILITQTLRTRRRGIAIQNLFFGELVQRTQGHTDDGEAVAEFGAFEGAERGGGFVVGFRFGGRVVVGGRGVVNAFFWVFGGDGFWVVVGGGRFLFDGWSGGGGGSGDVGFGWFAAAGGFWF